MIAHLINTDVGNRGVLRLYLEYRRERPDFLIRAARLLLNNNERVLLVTGFPIPPAMRAETDGPPGALALYRAVERLGGTAEILTYPEVREALRPFRVRFAEKPEVSEYSLVVAIETPGRAADGKYYSMGGMEITRETFDRVVIEARELGVPTIGIGDGGNEAGMGKIKELVERYVPLGRKIASVVETDELVLSAVSNWGAYGLLAELSMIIGENLLNGWDDAEVVDVLKRNGIIDGVTKRAERSVDGIDIRLHRMIVNLINSLIRQKIKD